MPHLWFSVHLSLGNVLQRAKTLLEQVTLTTKKYIYLLDLLLSSLNRSKFDKGAELSDGLTVDILPVTSYL